MSAAETTDDLCQRLADKLIAIGWRPTGDAQHEQLAGAIGDLRQMLVPVQMEMLRDQFAMAALPALTATWFQNSVDISGITTRSEYMLSKIAYGLADSMLRAREGGAS